MAALSSNEIAKGTGKHLLLSLYLFGLVFLVVSWWHKTVCIDALVCLRRGSRGIGALHGEESLDVLHFTLIRAVQQGQALGGQFTSCHPLRILLLLIGDTISTFTTQTKVSILFLMICLQIIKHFHSCLHFHIADRFHSCLLVQEWGVWCRTSDLQRLLQGPLHSLEKYRSWSHALIIVCCSLTYRRGVKAHAAHCKYSFSKIIQWVFFIY